MSNPKGRPPVDWLDAMTLAQALCGLKEDTELSEVEEALDEQFEVSFDAFHKLVEALVPFTPMARTVLGKKLVRGFVNGDNFIIKVQVPELDTPGS